MPLSSQTTNNNTNYQQKPASEQRRLRDIAIRRALLEHYESTAVEPDDDGDDCDEPFANSQVSQ